MTDPLRGLREPIRPVDPDPVFARRLRARLERALALPRGVVPVTADAPITDRATTDPPTADGATGTRTAVPRPAAVPYLAVADARAAIAWYAEVFGAAPAEAPIEMPDGRIGHCDLLLAGGHLYLSDAHPEIGVTAPRPGESTVSLMLPVTDTDAVRRRAVAAGATGDRPPYDGYGERHAWIVDPFGHRWGLHSPLRPEPSYRPGDVVHLALCTPDAERTRAFYADVLGWTYLPDGRVSGSVPSIGFRPGAPRITGAYAVPDLAAALDRVRAAGGRAGAIERHDWGTVAECLDDQGTPLRLHELAVTDAAPPVPRPGDPSYLTMQVPDSGRARAFYGTVLDWRIVPGRVEDGWQVQDVAPMVGISGGHEQATVVPVWTVADVGTAVATVRARGGRAGEPRREPYGTLADCVDDQGLPFGLLAADD